MSIFEGAGVALVTPFHEDGSVNFEKLEQLVEEQIAGGTDCIIACGTTGEAATLTHEEHLEVIRFVCKVVNKRIPVVAGTGSNCTDTAVYLSIEAEKAGADVLQQIHSERPESTFWRCCESSEASDSPLQCSKSYRCQHYSGDHRGSL